MKTDVLASIFDENVWYETRFKPFELIQLIDMPDEISEIVINSNSIIRTFYKEILDNKVIYKKINTDELSRLLKMLSKTKNSEILEFITEVFMPLTFYNEDCQDDFNDMINELDFVSKVKLEKMDKLYLFYNGLNLERSSSERLKILKDFINISESYYALNAYIEIVNDKNIFSCRNSNEVIKMLSYIKYRDRQKTELNLSILTNQNILRSTTIDDQIEILDLVGKYSDKKAEYIKNAACLLDLGSHNDNMNILLEMSEEKDIDKVGKIYDYIELIYGKEKKNDITYNRIIEQINIISPTIELYSYSREDMEKFYSILKCNNIDHFDTNTELYAKNDRGRNQKVKLR